MSSEDPVNTAAEIPQWLKATEEDFSATDINAPLVGIDTVDCHEVSNVYSASAKEAAALKQSSQERSFAMLGAIASFYFKPRERDEPFGPMARFGVRRTAQPSDFIGAAVAVLARQVGRLQHPAIRTRVADVVWLLDRKQASAGQAALSGYAEIVSGVRDGTFKFGSEGIDTYEVVDHLRRAIQIAKAIGWDTEAAVAVRNLTADLRKRAAGESLAASFQRLATLDLDYSIADPGTVAAEAEGLAKSSAELHSRHTLLHISARGYRKAGRQPDADGKLLEAAECLVSIASAGDGSAMFETHWLEKAITELQHVPNTKERRRQLKHQLVDAQSRIIDELTRFSHSQDISEIVTAAKDAVSGKPLMAALRSFATLSVAPTPTALEESARSQIAENPIAAIFASTTYDAGGKPVHRDAGMEGASGEGALQRQIARAEEIRRSFTAQGQIEPARLTIIQEHYVSEEVVGLICGHSPFIPGDREALFASGILHFFRGDMISALHTLVPQLENSLRHVLRMHGHDVTKLNEDMTQQDLSLSAILDRLRPEMERIFGSHMVTDIDNVFNYSGGPNLRNRVSHGLVGDWVPFAADSIYACWLILQLCCIPLLQGWEELSEVYEQAGRFTQLESFRVDGGGGGKTASDPPAADGFEGLVEL